MTGRLTWSLCALAALASLSGCSSDTRDKRNALQSASASAAANGADPYDGKSKPKLSKVNPDSGAPEGGYTVVLEGERFLHPDAGDTIVVWGSVAIPVTPIDDETIWLTVPPSPNNYVGLIDVYVVNDNGSGDELDGFLYEIEQKTKPKLGDLTPDHGPLTGGTPIQIDGKRFTEAGAGDTTVLFGSVGVPATVIDDDTLEVITPAGLAPGPVHVVVVNDLGADESLGGFTYDPSAYRLTFEPNVGQHVPGFDGTRITLTTDLSVGPGVTVAFDNLPATTISLVDSHTLVAEVPLGLTPGDHVPVTVGMHLDLATQQGFFVHEAPDYGDLFVNEFLPDAEHLDANRDGVIQPKGDEFIELVNTKSRPMDLSGMTLLDGSGEVRHVFPNPTTVPSEGAIVVFGFGTPLGFAPPHRSGHAQTATSGELGLSNSADQIELRDATGRVLYLLPYDDSDNDTSWNRKNDGDRVTDNPADFDDKYKKHENVDDAVDVISPGRRVDGSPF